ncbi:geranylgeranylglyceryl/heptaprenylglyceryl phosphate synthase [Flavobacterium faecale]|uniref:Geranylgeranylglyceryl phosphate synthase n=2 Tax=Flavobacterium faecale TaxID=1355330 RepID=A0A2S1LIC2_9FLAO|nr:geranylgeranylglyceryl/heptaprenylglyceryl phosphate synthase [Flavobacterium faecale]AWG23535.1 geranylgeranylglyceryl/heptaprenylglyceryl phosphate synthase [Flavobacterium faecale]
MQKYKEIYQNIVDHKSTKTKLLAILLDPDKIDWSQFDTLVDQINNSPATHVFIGGSLVFSSRIDELILRLKAQIQLPILLFPGDPSQISKKADGILFLSLVSGRNPDFLIGHQVKSAPILKSSGLEIIPTAYILIESGGQTAVERVSQTKPIAREQHELVVATAMASEMMGSKMVYLEAGSGAKCAVPTSLVKNVVTNVDIPVIVGGGITSANEINEMYAAGADLVVIGTAFENDYRFFEHFQNELNIKTL